MKKTTGILALLLACLMIFFMASCKKSEIVDNDQEDQTTLSSSENDPVLSEEEYKNLFNAAFESISNVAQNGISGKLNAKIQTEMGEDRVTVPIDASLALQVADGKLSALTVEYSMSLMGETQKGSIYTDGTNMYTNASGYKYYEPIPEDQDLSVDAIISELLAQYMPTESDDEANIEIPESLTKYMEENIKIEYKNDSENVYSINVTVTKENFDVLFDEIILLIAEQAGVEPTDDDMAEIDTIKDAIRFDQFTASLVLDNNSKTLNFTLNGSLGIDNSLLVPTDVAEEPQIANISLDINLVIDHIGENPTVTAPADLDSYELIEEIPDDEHPDEYYDCMVACFELFDENGDPVENYDALYASLVEIYGKDMVDEVLLEFEAL